MSICVEIGVQTQSVLMSVYKTLKLRGQAPLDTSLKSLNALNEIGKLTQLLEKMGS